MNMPTISEVPAGKSAPNQGGDRAADAARAGRPKLTESVVHGGSVDRPDRPKVREGADTHAHVHGGGPANHRLSDRAKQMLANLDKHGDINGPKEGAREAGTSTAGVTVVETAGTPTPASATSAASTESAAATAETSTEKPAAGDQPATSEPVKETPAEPAKEPEKAAAAPAEPDAKLKADLDRLQTHNRKLVAELEARSSAAPALDDRHKELDAIERMAIENPIGALERLFTLAIGAKESKDPAVQRFLSGVYGDWTEQELKVPMDKAARAAFGTERNKHLIDRDRRERAAGETTAAEKAKAADRERDVRDTVTTLDRQLAESKHGEKYPHLMNSELFDGITPGQRLFTAIAHGIAAGDWDKVPSDDKLVEHYSTKLNKELEARDQKLRAHYAPKSPPSTATPTPASEPSKDKAADAPSKEAQAGVRTITNASASVAPPKPPVATAPATTAKDDKTPIFRNEAERRLWLARKHFEDASP